MCLAAFFCGNPLICHDFYFEDCTCLEHQKKCQGKKGQKYLTEKILLCTLQGVILAKEHSEVSFCLSFEKGFVSSGSQQKLTTAWQNTSL